ncbi:hypothetical protein SERLA73DRAFT_68781 [Serpula lacrymans var. lacrymans S7.3]|uniref:Uncharacterized protein n=1 Tax=Serpula lacrymans var. lacrymans (strain S7.3) TaxID=936435 RepID=F8PIA5_SERL3|nr:hypothetical protein SERLA73DRAFT_68781 [Serpula lacrymans var. lacrymans S7.3]
MEKHIAKFISPIQFFQEKREVHIFGSILLALTDWASVNVPPPIQNTPDS